MPITEYLASIALLLFIGNSLSAAELPPDFKARYGAYKYGSRVAEMRLSLQRQGENLEYRSHSKPRGLAALLTDQEITETSKLSSLPAGSAPRLQSYHYQHQQRAKKNQQFSVSYPASQQAHVQGSYGKNQVFQLNSDAPLWDRLSVQLALIHDIGGQPVKGQQYRYNIVDDGRIEQYVFEYDGAAELEIDQRRYQTLLFKRHHGKRSTQLWLAPELHYLPVQIRQYKDDELHLSMALENIEL